MPPAFIRQAPPLKVLPQGLPQGSRGGGEGLAEGVQRREKGILMSKSCGVCGETDGHAKVSEELAKKELGRTEFYKLTLSQREAVRHLLTKHSSR